MGKLTISDIARLSGFSKTSVSFAFNNPSRLKKETLDKILEVCKNNNYWPSALARNLSNSKTYNIGFLLPQKVEKCLDNPYIMQLIKTIGQVCESKGYNLTIITLYEDNLSTAISNSAVDAIISLGVNVQKQIKKSIKIKEVPCVIIDGYDSSSIYNVGIDNEGAAYDIMKLVLNNKHKKIGIIALQANSNNEYSGVAHLRLKGFKRALKEYNIDIFHLYTSETRISDAQNVFRKIIKEHPDISVIVCMSDIIAIGCIKEATKCGIVIPDELSITGFDNIVEAELITPNLTTVDQSPSMIGKKAADLIFKLLDKQEISLKRYEMNHHIIIRNSLYEAKN